MSARSVPAAAAVLVALAVVAVAAPAHALAPAKGYVSCRDRAPGAAPAPSAAARAAAVPPVPAEQALAEIEDAVRRFQEEGKGFRTEVQQIVKKEFEEKKRFLGDHFEQAIKDLEVLERNERESAIGRFEEFLARYPDDPQFTPDAMFRLAELYYEKANDDFALVIAQNREQARAALADGREPPPEPMKSYAPSIALYQRLITGFPNYKFIHGITYLMAYCLGEMGQGDEAQAAYASLIERYPDSAFVPEAWVRLGDWHFDDVRADSLQRAAEAFSKMYAFPAHPLYARAIYKLGWTYYRMDDYQKAVESFSRLLDHYVAVAQKTGEKPSGDVWPEAIQYAAISFADERWGGVAKARAFFKGLGGRPYEGEIYGRMGDVYFDETKYALAVEAYKAVLESDPLSPDAPKVQAKIVLCWSRDRQFEKEAAEREALVAAYAEGTPWATKNRGDPDLVNAVRDLSEKSLLRAASFHHAQAQKYKQESKLEAAVAEYRVAARAYGSYLERFPHSKQAHELSYNWADCLYNALEFEKAARVYAQVRDDPASVAFQAEAAHSAVVSWEGEVTRLQREGRLDDRKVLLSTDRKDKDVVQAEALPAPLQDLVRESDAFTALLPADPKVPAVAYKAAEVFYRYNDFGEARCRFEEVVGRWPAADVSKFAANLIIESYLTMKDWSAVEQASARLQSAEVAKNPELARTLQKFKLGGRFNRAMQLMDAKQYEDGAKLFIALVQEEPTHEFADKALYNAASCYEGARRFESALKLYERISAEYPKSTLADEALFRVGWNAENTYEFEKAVERYLALVENYPNSKHRKDALYNAARSLENLQKYEPAAAAFARYARAYPDAEDAARTQFHAALIYEKTQDWRKQVLALQDFVRRFSRTKEHDLVVQAQLKIGLAQRELQQEKEARAAYAEALREYRSRGLDPDKNVRAAAAAAEANFRLAEVDFERWDRITLPPNLKKMQAALKTKLAEVKPVAAQYDAVAAYKRPDWILAAFYRKAFMLERLAQTLYDAPVPPDVKKDEELLAAYQDQLAQAAAPYEESAVKVYVAAIEQAHKLHVKNEWTKKIGESLARYRPSEYPILKDAKAQMVVEDVSPAAFGDTPAGPAAPAPAPAAAPVAETVAAPAAAPAVEPAAATVPPAPAPVAPAADAKLEAGAKP